MCGISAVFGKNAAEKAVKICIGQIERGELGAGVATVRNGHIVYAKVPDSPAVLLEKYGDIIRNFMNDTGVAIGHNRQPAGSSVSYNNTHPFMACNGEFVLVHNGYFTVYEGARKILSALGHTFRGTTDSEFAMHTLEEFVLRYGWENGVRRFMEFFENCGTFVVLRYDGTVFAMRTGTQPLYLVYHGDEIYMCSEVHALCELGLEGQKVKVLEPDRGTYIVVRPKAEGGYEVRVVGSYKVVEKTVEKPKYVYVYYPYGRFYGRHHDWYGYYDYDWHETAHTSSGRCRDCFFYVDGKCTLNVKNRNTCDKFLLRVRGVSCWSCKYLRKSSVSKSGWICSHTSVRVSDLPYEVLENLHGCKYYEPSHRKDLCKHCYYYEKGRCLLNNDPQTCSDFLLLVPNKRCVTCSHFNHKSKCTEVKVMREDIWDKACAHYYNRTGESCEDCLYYMPQLGFYCAKRGEMRNLAACFEKVTDPKKVKCRDCIFHGSCGIRRKEGEECDSLLIKATYDKDVGACCLNCENYDEESGLCIVASAEKLNTDWAPKNPGKTLCVEYSPREYEEEKGGSCEECFYRLSNIHPKLCAVYGYIEPFEGCKSFSRTPTSCAMCIFYDYCRHHYGELRGLCDDFVLCVLDRRFPRETGISCETCRHFDPKTRVCSALTSIKRRKIQVTKPKETLCELYKPRSNGDCEKCVHYKGGKCYMKVNPKDGKKCEHFKPIVKPTPRQYSCKRCANYKRKCRVPEPAHRSCPYWRPK